MPKEYPGFIIDRSRRSDQSKHIDDYLVCTDLKVGFIAKIYKLNKTQFSEYNKRLETVLDADCFFIAKNFGAMAVVMEVVKLFCEPLIEKQRLKSLLKKGLKAYLFSEASKIKGDGSKIDMQIAAVNDMVDVCQAQFDNLVLNNGEAAAISIIANLRAASESLTTLKMLLNYDRKES